jgi:hypothetical protein
VTDAPSSSAILQARLAAALIVGLLILGAVCVSTARILILGVVMDVIYQWVVFKTFYPAQAAVIAVLLAFVPYLLLRGPMERVARHWVARPAVK